MPGRRHLARALVAMALLIFGGRAFSAEAAKPDAAPARNPAPTAALPGYRLMPNDTVQVTVFGEEELSTVARVGKDGGIEMALIGLVKISGQTIREAARTIEVQLRDYLVKPQVALSIAGYSKRHFTILGQVGKVGIIEMPDETPVDLLEAIGLSGGYTRLANPSKITLKRIVDGQETLFKLDGKRMLDRGGAERFQVLPGDTIIVAERLF